MLARLFGLAASVNLAAIALGLCSPMKDGSLLVSDDYDGAVYRITYGEGGGGTH